MNTTLLLLMLAMQGKKSDNMLPILILAFPQILGNAVTNTVNNVTSNVVEAVTAPFQAVGDWFTDTYRAPGETPGAGRSW